MTGIEAVAPLEVAMATDRVPAAVGQPCEVQVTVRNRAATPVDIVVRAIGTADGLVDPVTVGPLAPGETAIVPVQFHVPDRFPGQELTAAVELVAGVAGGAPDDEPLGRIVLPVALVLSDGGEVLARLLKRDLRGRRRGRLRLVLENRSHHPVEVRLGSDSPTGQVRITLPEAPVAIEPGDSAVVEGRVKARLRLWGSIDRHPFGVLVTTRRGTQRLPGNFSHRPLFARGLMRGLGVLVALAVWASALVVGLDRVGRDDSDAEIAQAAGQESDDGTSVADGAGGTGGDGTGGDGEGEGDGEGDEDPGDPAPTVQLGGVVSGRAPEAVRVSVEPISLVDAQRQGVAFASTIKAPPPIQGLTKAVAGTGVRRPIVPVDLASATSDPAAQAGPVARPTQVGPVATTTDSDGRWAVAGVRAPGFYLVTFSKPGFETTKRVVEAVAGADGVNLDLALEAGTGSITGVISGPDGPLGGAEVTATDGTLLFTTRTASTGAEVGRYTFEGLSTPSTYLVSAERWGFGQEGRLVELSGGGSAGGIDLALQPGVAAVSGVITSPEGARGGMTVTISNGEIVREATTLTENPVGSFLLPQLPLPGTYTLTVEGLGWGTESRSVELTGNARVDVQVFRTTASLTGRVVDASGAGLGAVGITLESDDGQVFRSSSAAGGTFTLSNITPGPYVVAFERFSYLPTTVLVELVAGSSRDIDVRLDDAPPDTVPRTASITGAVRNADDLTEGVPDAIVEATLSDGTVATATTDSGGNFSLADLPPGIHRLRTTHPEFGAGDARVRVGTGATATADILVTAKAGITGQVLSGGDGGALAGATVTIAPAGDPSAAIDLPVDGQGRFSLQRAFAAGVHRITVDADLHNQLVQDVVLTPPEVEEVILRPVRRGRLQVVTRGTNLQALSDVEVRLEQPDGTTVAGPLVTPSDGTVLFDDLDGGTYRVVAERSSFTTAERTFFVQLNTPTPPSTTLFLGQVPSDLAGQITWVRNGTPTPVGGAVLEVTYVTAVSENPSGGPPLVTTDTNQIPANASGEFSRNWQNDLPPGAPRPVSSTAPQVVISAPGFATRTLTDVNISTTAFNQTLVPLPGVVDVAVQLRDDILGSSPGDGAVQVQVVSSPAEAGTVVASVAGGQLTVTDSAIPGAVGLSPGPYRFSFSRTGHHPPAPIDIEVLPGGRDVPTIVQPPVTVTLDRYSQITVRPVSKADPNDGGEVATPVGGVRYELFQGGVEVGDVTVAGGTTQHTFAELEAGTYTVRISRPGFVAPGGPPVQSTVSITVGLVVGEQADREVTFRRQGSISGLLRGRAGANDTPVILPGVTVTAVGPDSDTTTFPVTTEPNGTFSITGLEAGTYRLTASPPQYQPFELTGVEVAAGANTAVPNDDLILQKQTVQVSGTVRDDSAPGNPPLGGVRLTFTTTDGTQEISPPSVLTAPNGTYSISGLIPQMWTVRVELSSYSPIETTLNLEPHAGGQFEYSPRLVQLVHSVLGVVRGGYPGGQQPALGDAAIEVRRLDGTLAGSATSAPGGSFTVPDLRPGPYNLSITVAGHQPLVNFPIAVPTNSDLNLGDLVRPVVPRQVQLTVHSSLTDGAGDPLAIDSRQVQLVAAAGSTGVTTGGQTDSAGALTLGSVVPGGYTIEVDDAGLRPGASVSLTVLPGLTTDGTVGTAVTPPTVVVPEGRIAGTVTTQETSTAPLVPRPAHDVTVTARPGAPVTGAQTVATDTDPATEGTYEVIVAPGTDAYDVSSTAPTANYAPVATREEVTVTAGATTTVDFPFQQFGSLAVTVVDADDDDAPLVGATVTLDVDGVAPQVTLTGGLATFPGLVPGTTVTVTAAFTGYQPAGPTPVTATVPIGAAAAVEVRLVPVPPPDPP